MAFTDTTTRGKDGSSTTTGGWGSTVGSIGQGLGGLANAFIGYKQLGLAEDQFDFNKSLTNRNIKNQGKLVNQGLANQLSTTQAMTRQDVGQPQRDKIVAENMAARADISAI